MNQKERIKTMVDILVKKINDRKFGIIPTGHIIEELITTLEFKDEQELVNWFKSSKFEFQLWTHEKYYRGIKELGHIHKGKVYDKTFQDQYDLFTPDVLIQMYLKEGKGLTKSIELACTLFWANIKELRSLGNEQTMRKKLFK